MSKSKKIKLLFRHRSMEMGGVEKVLLSILNNLNPEKFEMTVCLNLNQGELRDEFPAHVRKVYLTDGKEDFSKNQLIQKAQLFKRSQKLKKYQQNPHLVDEKILKDSFDIEVGMTYNDFEMVLNSSNKKSKKVGWFHSEIQIPKMQTLVPKILQQFPEFDAMVYCSQRIEDLMHQHHPTLNYPEERVIINAIPINEIKSKATEKIENFPSGPVFFSLGRLHTRKGFHKLIDAHAKLIKEGLPHHVIILGEGEEFDNLKNQIKEQKVQQTFTILPFAMNPYPYMKQADFFILPSESEAWPLVIAEALILQKPIIATDVGDVSKMIRDQETGLLIKYDTNEMADAMRIFLTKPDVVDNLKEHLKTIEEQFDNQKIFNEIEETFINLLKN